MFNTDWNHSLEAVDKFFAQQRENKSINKMLFLLSLLAVIIITYLLSFSSIGKNIDYSLGDIANEEVRVSQDIRYEIAEETEKLRQEAYNKQRYIFNRNYEAFKRVVSELQIEFQVLGRTAGETGSLILAYERLPFLKDSSLYKPEEISECFRPQNRRQLESWAVKYATLFFDNRGVMAGTLPDESNLAVTGALVKTINTSDEINEIIWDREKIVTPANLLAQKHLAEFHTLGDRVFLNQLSSPARKLVVTRVLQLFAENPYLHYNESETRHYREQAARNIKPVTGLLKKGLIILRPGDPVDNDRLQKIKILNSVQNKLNLKVIFGNFLVQLVLALAFWFYIGRNADYFMKDFSSQIILHSLILLSVFLAFGISRLDIVRENEMYLGLFVPVGFASIIAGILFGPRIAMPMGLYLAFFLYFLANRDTGTLLIAFVTVIASLYAAAKMKTRTHFLKGATITGTSIALVVIGMDLWQNEYGVTPLRIKIVLSFLNAYGGVILALGILPIYETLFNLPTKFRLMELGDFNQPLLRKLAAEAPSTYTHSLMMANLSERAVSHLGGDTLLTRVGCLYHDIGKIVNAGFYAENKHMLEEQEKIKKELSPIEYADVIIHHVIDGVRMARQYRLPEKVVAFIPEHHGTATMRYFYHMALEKQLKRGKELTEENSGVLKELFCYPGPRPQSKETGVVMLADSVEAASRSLAHPNQENLTELVETITAGKIAEKQLDECPLTMADLKIIKETFVEVLLSSFHVRPRYPSVQKTAGLEKSLKKKARPEIKQTGKPKTSVKKTGKK